MNDGGDAAVAVDLVCSACDGRCEQRIEVSSAVHVAGAIEYPDPPPVGGPHDPCWGDYGAYRDPPLPARRFVHNLEHGAVVFAYNCPKGCEAEVEQLEELSVLPRVIVTPYEAMPAGFAALAWGVRLTSSCLDMDAMRGFYAAHFDHGPESVSSGAPSGCSQ